MEMASEMALDGIIAPMCESSFAVEKFGEAVTKFGFSSTTLTIETKTAAANIQGILDTALAYGIRGITVGRGDLAASMGLKGNENATAVMDVTREICFLSRSMGFFTTIGGNMSPEALTTILASDLEFDALETRRVCFQVDRGNPQDSYETLSNAISLELQIERTIHQVARRRQITVDRRLDQLEARVRQSFA
jgi:hypothetical protein